MKNIYYLVAVAVASVFVSGCGDDRSHGTYDMTLREVTKVKSIVETESGKILKAHNFIYVPGGFDVDDDGLIDGGFWVSKYEARESNETDTYVNIANITNVQSLVKNSFKLYNANSKYKKFDKELTQNSNYISGSASSIKGLEVTKVIFSDKKEAINMISPLEAVISLKGSQIDGAKEIKLPSEKQWMHLVKLIINNPKNWTGGKVGEGKLYQGKKYGNENRKSFFIENSILGVDKKVAKNYQAEIYDFSGGVAEWTSGMVAIEDRFLTGDSGKHEFEDVNSAPLWWKPILKNKKYSLSSTDGAGQYHDGFSLEGTNDTLEVSSKGTGNVDSYAVVARGGSSSKDDQTLVGVSAAKLTYGLGYKGPTVGFRAATGYLY
jgi:hypothetical protein